MNLWCVAHSWSLVSMNERHTHMNERHTHMNERHTVCIMPHTWMSLVSMSDILYVFRSNFVCVSDILCVFRSHFVCVSDILFVCRSHYPWATHIQNVSLMDTRLSRHSMYERHTYKEDSCPWMSDIHVASYVFLRCVAPVCVSMSVAQPQMSLFTICRWMRQFAWWMRPYSQFVDEWDNLSDEWDLIHNL